MEIVRASVDDVLNAANFSEFVRDYGEESGNPGLLQFPPNIERYKELERNGELEASAVFDGDNLVAVVSLLFHSIPHFTAQFAAIETIWVHKDYRKKGFGIRMVHEARRLAKERGAEGMYIGCRYGSKFQRVLEHIATPMNVTFWMSV